MDAIRTVECETSHKQNLSQNGYGNEGTGYILKLKKALERGGIRALYLSLRIQVCPKSPGFPRTNPIPGMGLRPSILLPEGVWIHFSTW